MVSLTWKKKNCCCKACVDAYVLDAPCCIQHTPRPLLQLQRVQCAPSWLQGDASLTQETSALWAFNVVGCVALCGCALTGILLLSLWKAKLWVCSVAIDLPACQPIGVCRLASSPAMPATLVQLHVLALLQA